MKKKVSILLILTMIVTLIPTAVFAKSSVKNGGGISYVALGDSMAQGYMFTDYNEDPENGHSCGYQGSSERSSIKQFYKYLQNQYGVSNVTLTDLSIQGFQPDELFALFREKYESGYSIGNDKSLTAGAKMHFSNWVKEAGAYPDLFDTYKDMSNHYIDSIENADILTYDIGINYFGTYLEDRASGLAASETGEHFTELLSKLTNNEVKEIEQLRAKIEGLLKSIGLDALGDNMDGMLYAYLSYIYYTDQCINKIYEINPDVKLILVGLYNPHPELYIEADGAKFSYSKIMEIMMESLNLTQLMMNKYKDKCIYVDMMENPAISFADELYYYADELSLDAKCNLLAMAAPLYGDKDCTYMDAYIEVGNDVASDVNLSQIPPYAIAALSYATLPPEMGGPGRDAAEVIFNTYFSDAQMSTGDAKMFTFEQFSQTGGGLLWPTPIIAGFNEIGEPFIQPMDNKFAAYECGTDAYPFKISQYLYDFWTETYSAQLQEFNGNKVLASDEAIKILTAYFNNPVIASWGIDANFASKAYEAVEKGNAIDWQKDIVGKMEAVLEACTKALSYRSFTVLEFLQLAATGTIKGADITRTVNDPKNATSADFKALHWAIRHGKAVRGFGSHPSPQGQEAKLENIINAYEKNTTVNKALISKIASTDDAIKDIAKLGLQAVNFTFGLGRSVIKTAIQLAKNPFRFINTDASFLN